jgi:maleylpyruvate isomerase
MSAPTAQLTALRASTTDLLDGIVAEAWTDAQVRAPSLLPGWTRGHVLTHIARNADGIARAMSGALRGEIVPRYPGGRAGRDADIEAGATRTHAELVADVRESAERLARVIDAVAAADGWELPTEDLKVGEYVLGRWREVEVHRVDLAGSYTAEQWPTEFVAYLLPEVAAGLDARATVPMRVTVTPERGTVPELASRVWTVDEGDRVEVGGPDWALLAWLIGRPEAAAGLLGAPPEVLPWR